MLRGRGATARSPWSWVLALGFVALIDAGITRTWILWGPTSYEHTLDLKLVQLAQTYQAERKIYAPTRTARDRVAVLGDSRIWFGAPDRFVEEELHRLVPLRDVRVDNLGIFGALVGDLEVVSRHLERVDPTLVVLALGGVELVPGATGNLGNWPMRLMRVGLRDGPIPPESESARVDRWLRTFWPLYRFREFARAAVKDRVVPGAPQGRPLPAHVTSPRIFFDYLYGTRGAEVDAAWSVWRTDPTYARFVDYLQVAHEGLRDGAGAPLRRGDLALGPDSPGLRVLDALLGRLAGHGWRTMIVLVPENPLLAQDTDGRFHVPGFSDHAAGLIRASADRYGARFIDARRWMPPEVFFDFVHLMPELSGFDKPFAGEIARALPS